MTMISRTSFLSMSNSLEEIATTYDTERKGSGNVYVGGSGEDVVVNYSNGAKIYTGAGNDTVTSIGAGVIIDTGDDEDSIIAVGTGTQINAGAGNDRVFVQDITPSTRINLGTGADTLYMQGYGNENTLVKDPADYEPDVYLTPGFVFKYIKGKGLIIDYHSLK